MLEWDASDPARPIAVVDVACSAGTYVRALARDLGARLESGAYLGALVRTASGSFRLEDARPLDALREHAADGPAGIERVLRPIDAGLEDLPHAPMTPDEVRRLGEGLITAPRRRSWSATPRWCSPSARMARSSPSADAVAGRAASAQGARRAPGRRPGRPVRRDVEAARRSSLT